MTTVENQSKVASAEEQSTDVLEDTGTETIGHGRKIFKFIVIGDSNVGKTCLTYRFCSGKFLEKTEATVGVDFREKILDVEGEMIKLQIWDTAGQERFRRSMVPHYYRNVSAIIFVYDVSRVSSFEHLPSWFAECEAYGIDASVPRILVGNKCDIQNDGSSAFVSTSWAQRFADSYGMPLFETSAKDNNACDHVESIFLTVVHKLKNCKSISVPSCDQHYGRVILSSRPDPADDRNSETHDYCMC